MPVERCAAVRDGAQLQHITVDKGGRTGRLSLIIGYAAPSSHLSSAPRQHATTEQAHPQAPRVPEYKTTQGSSRHRCIATGKMILIEYRLDCVAFARDALSHDRLSSD